MLFDATFEAQRYKTATLIDLHVFSPTEFFRKTQCVRVNYEYMFYRFFTSNIAEPTKSTDDTLQTSRHLAPELGVGVAVAV
jgi:hypothetical protein